MSDQQESEGEPRLLLETPGLAQYLGPADLCRACLVSREARAVFQADSRWSELYETEDWQFFEAEPEAGEEEEDGFWKREYGARAAKERELALGSGMGDAGDMHSLDDDELDSADMFGSPAGVSVDEMLQDPNLRLEQLLDVDEFLTALANHSPELLEYLKSGENAKRLIDFVVSPSKESDLEVDENGEPTEAAQEARRHTYVSYHALTSEAMTEILIEDYALLDKLLTFLDHPSENDALKNGYFSKILLTVYEKYPAELFLYFSIKNNVVAKFVQNINNLFLMELLFKFIDSLSSHQWLADERLIGQLVELLDEERYDVETQESAVRTLEIICNICSYCPFSALVTQILEDESVTQKLLAYTLRESPTMEFRIKQGLGIVIQVLNLLHKDPDEFGFDNFDEFGEEGAAAAEPAGGGEDSSSEPPYFVLEFTKRLPQFVEALRRPSSAPSHRNAGCLIESPFGFTRLRVLEFVVGLIGTGFPVVMEQLEKLEVFSICLGIFFEYRWNNFIHHQVYLLVSRVFTSSKHLASVEPILRKSRFVERVLEAFDKYDPTTAGYFGHIVELCNELLNVSTVSVKVAAYLEEFEQWPTFVREKLDVINEVCNTGPNAFAEDEESMEDYDADQYYFGIGQFNGDDDYEDQEAEPLGETELYEAGEELDEFVELTPEEQAQLDDELAAHMAEEEAEGEEEPQE